MKINTVYVEITNHCNLNCATCYNRSGLNKLRKEISCVQIEKIISTFIPYGLNRIIFSGGEPTLHTEFDKILDLTEKYPNLTFGVTTNGTNPHKKLLNYLNSKQNMSLQVSLDGSCEEANSKTRGKGNFKKTIFFLKQITNPNLSPLLKMVISQNNYYDVENFCNLAFSLNFTPEFAFIYRSGNSTKDWENKALTPLQKSKVLLLTEKLNKEKNANIFLPVCTVKCPFISKIRELSLCIKVDGSIQPCQGLYNEKFSVGNVFTFNIEEFYSKIEHIARTAKLRYKTDYGCENCLIKGLCGKGCMAEADNLYGNPLANDDNCLYRKQQFINLNLKGALKPIDEEKARNQIYTV